MRCSHTSMLWHNVQIEKSLYTCASCPHLRAPHFLSLTTQLHFGLYCSCNIVNYFDTFFIDIDGGKVSKVQCKKMTDSPTGVILDFLVYNPAIR